VVSNLEIGKDTVQVITESAADHIGKIALIITGAVREVAREVGDWATEAFEMRDAARTAVEDEDEPNAPIAPVTKDELG
jgi:hypothetical protein